VARFTVKDTGEIKAFRRMNLSMTLGIHPEDGAVKHGDLTVAQVAEINEYGGGNTPARMWLRGWAAKHGQRMANLLRSRLREMARTQNYKPDALEALAETMQRSMRGHIYSGVIKPKNAPATLARKAPETKPLIDTRQFVRSIRARLTAKAGSINWNYKSRGS
jgi:hypothetical protein